MKMPHKFVMEPVGAESGQTVKAIAAGRYDEEGHLAGLQQLSLLAPEGGHYVDTGGVGDAA